MVSFSFPADERLVPRYSEITQGPQERIYFRELWDATPLPLFGPGFEPGVWWNDGGVVALISAPGYPTSDAGLSPGDVWNNELTVAIVGPTAPDPSAPLLYFANMTPYGMLLLGGYDLPIYAPIEYGALWNNGGLLCVSDGGLPGEWYNNGGAVGLTSAPGYPTTPTGLFYGDIWANGNEATVYGPTTPDPDAAPLYFYDLVPYDLLVIGGSNLPITPPTAGSQQLWNNGGVVCIA